MNAALQLMIDTEEELARKYEARAQGLRASMKFAKPIPYSSHPSIQQCFVDGFKQGKGMQ